jgi:hypothetical protein
MRPQRRVERPLAEQLSGNMEAAPSGPLEGIVGDRHEPVVTLGRKLKAIEPVMGTAAIRTDQHYK